MKNLNEYRKNYFSQNGEDGVLLEIFDRIGIDVTSSNKNNFCVELGAWDGKKYSNTFSLVKNNNWKTLYIEGDSLKFKELQKTALEYKNINPVLAYIEADKDSKNSLNNILSINSFPLDFEILSIDIDSFDLAIWESFSDYKPKVVVIEINSSFLPGVLFWNSPGTQGNSFSSTLKVAESKNYTLVCHTGNMIFVRKDLVGKIKLEDRFYKYPELLFDSSYIKNKNFFSKVCSKIKTIFSNK